MYGCRQGGLPDHYGGKESLDLVQRNLKLTFQEKCAVKTTEKCGKVTKCEARERNVCEDFPVNIFLSLTPSERLNVQDEICETVSRLRCNDTMEQICTGTRRKRSVNELLSSLYNLKVSLVGTLLDTLEPNLGCEMVARTECIEEPERVCRPTTRQECRLVPHHNCLDLLEVSHANYMFVIWLRLD